MMENILLAQQKQDDYIKQSASKVDVLTTQNKMLEAQIAQQLTSSSTPPGRLPSKPESNPHKQHNYVTLKKGVEYPEDITLEEGREVIMAERKEKSDEDKPITFRENDNFDIPKVFSQSFLTQVAFLCPVSQEK